MTKQTELGADDFDGERPLTSHEREARQPWDVSYHDGPAPWDIGAPQPAVVRLAEERAFSGIVLDAGCGTGENALHIASGGVEVLGIDVAPTAISIARESASARGIDARFMLFDALRLDCLGRVFDTVLDCALFHAFDAGERRAYAASLASVLEPRGRLHLLCFSDVDEASAGPHPVSREELAAPFATSSLWRIASIGEERLLARFAPEGVAAWVANIERIEARD